MASADVRYSEAKRAKSEVLKKPGDEKSPQAFSMRFLSFLGVSIEPPCLRRYEVGASPALESMPVIAMRFLIMYRLPITARKSISAST